MELYKDTNSSNKREQIPSVLTVSELAKELRICTNTAYALLRSNQIRHIKIGRTYRIPRLAIDEYLGSQKNMSNL